MLLEDLRQAWIAFRSYTRTEAYREGLYVEMTSMLLEITLLVILLPLLIWLYHLPAKLQALKTASFLSLKFIRSCTELLLMAGGVSAPREVLNYELEKGRLGENVRHFVYGDTADLLKILQSRMRRATHVLGHRSLEIETIQMLKEQARALVIQCEQYTTLFASLRLHAHAENFFKTGVMLLSLRDYLEVMKPLVRDGTSRTDSFRIQSTNLATLLSEWFADERRRPDRAFKWIVRLTTCMMLFVLPYALLHRFLIGPGMTFLGKRYRSPFSLEITRVLVEAAFLHAGRPTVFTTLAVTERKLRAVLNGDCASEESIAVLQRLRALFAPGDWDKLLVQTIAAELLRLMPNIVTADSIVASSTVVYARAAVQPEASTILRLMTWKTSYEGIFGLASAMTEEQDRSSKNR